MSGMDRLTDADVEWHAAHGAPLSAAMARELLAHRRASQAAPAPIYHGDLSILPDTEDKFRDMVCATAPSDGLREALLREVLKCQERNYGYGMGLHKAMIPLAERIRAALSTPTEERQ